MKKTLPTPTMLRELLHADYDAGLLWWKARPASMFPHARYTPEINAHRWNRRMAGTPAITADIHGYRGGIVLSHRLLAHRILWAMYHDAWPTAQIDHINGLRHDNRLANLREVSHYVNAQNAVMMRNNTTGATGVYRMPNSRWRAIIHANGVRIDLGRFDHFHEAVSARRMAEAAHGFSARHGRDPNTQPPRKRKCVESKMADEAEFIESLRRI